MIDDLLRAMQMQAIAEEFAEYGIEVFDDKSHHNSGYRGTISGSKIPETWGIYYRSGLGDVEHVRIRGRDTFDWYLTRDSDGARDMTEDCGYKRVGKKGARRGKSNDQDH